MQLMGGQTERFDLLKADNKLYFITNAKSRKVYGLKWSKVVSLCFTGHNLTYLSASKKGDSCDEMPKSEEFAMYVSMYGTAHLIEGRTAKEKRLRQFIWTAATSIFFPKGPLALDSYHVYCVVLEAIDVLLPLRYKCLFGAGAPFPEETDTSLPATLLFTKSGAAKTRTNEERIQMTEETVIDDDFVARTNDGQWLLQRPDLELTGGTLPAKK